MERVYESQMTTNSIKATSRCAIKISDNYYTVEATEERTLTGDSEVLNLDKEWELLYDSVNNIVDNQCQEIIDTFTKKKKK